MEVKLARSYDSGLVYSDGQLNCANTSATINCSRTKAVSTRINVFSLGELCACGTVYQLNRGISVA